MMGMDTEVEALRTAVSRYFRVYDTIVHPFAVTFKVFADPTTLDANFDGLRRELIPQNFIPAIAVENGEHVVHVQRRPPARFARPYVNIVLLAATVGTTLLAGALQWADYTGTSIYQATTWALGFLAFSLPLLTILGSHEMGHYIVAKRYHVHASLPFFLPSVPPLGTFGAFISMRDPIPNRRALLDIGVSGPIVGFLVSIPVIFLGLWLMALNPVLLSSNAGGQIALGPMFIFELFLSLFPIPGNAAVHPTVFAGWVGLFVTSINLLPAGQLDGGHIARALLGERAGVLSWLTILLLLGMGIAFYPSWVIFAVVILMLGARHPPPLNDLTRLAPSRKLVAWLAIGLLVLTFAPSPFVQLPEHRSFEFEVGGPPFTPVSELRLNATAGTTTLLQFRVNNTGNVLLDLALHIDDKNLGAPPFNWRIVFASVLIDGQPSGTVTPSDAAFKLNSSVAARVTVAVSVPASFPSTTVLFAIEAHVNQTAIKGALAIRVTVRP